MQGPNEPHELTPWFNAESHPPIRPGEYNLRGNDPSWLWNLKECRAKWDGKVWEYPNPYGKLGHSPTVVSCGSFRNLEWQGLVGPEPEPRNMEVDRHESDTDNWW